MNPAAFRWTGDAFEPLRRFKPQLDRELVIGEVYTLTELDARSGPQHRWYFAAVREAWTNLPEGLAELYPSPEHLRKRALVQAGFYLEQMVDAGTAAAALRVAAAFRTREEFSHVVVRGPLVVIRSPKSQSYREMPKGEFRASVDAVMDVLAKMIEVAPAALDDHARAA